MTTPDEVSEGTGACRWEAVCQVGDVPEGEVRGFEPAGCPAVAIYNVDGRFYASDDVCTHEEVCLSDGELDGDIIECPLHGGSFNVVTGEVESRPPRKPVRVHETRLEGATVQVLLPEESPEESPED